MGKKTVCITFILIIVFLAALVLAASQKNQTKECKRNCSEIKRNETKICLKDYKECRILCREEKKTCLNEIKQNFSECKEECDDRKCVRNCSEQMREGKKDCSKKGCLPDCRNKIKTCKEEVKTNFSYCRDSCKINIFEVSEEECDEGLFHELCNGPYFDIVCSQEEYCICGGDAEYECPEGYECNEKIRNLLPRKQTIEGYKDLLGNDLGDIGVCEKI